MQNQKSQKTSKNKARASGARISVRRNRDGSVTMTSRGASARDLREVAPALIGILEMGSALTDADPSEAPDPIQGFPSRSSPSGGEP